MPWARRRVACRFPHSSIKPRLPALRATSDVVALYALAITKAPAGTFMYVESGEAALGEIVQAIAARLGLGPAQPWSADEAIAAWGRNMATFSLGSNSRVRSEAAADLGWAPKRRSVIRWIAEELG